MVQMARFFMQFTQNESCGKCVLCREGTKQMLSLLDDDDLQDIEDLAKAKADRRKSTKTKKSRNAAQSV
jgi:NADH-quinone oxidoreductase subunit F